MLASENRYAECTQMLPASQSSLSGSGRVKAGAASAGAGSMSTISVCKRTMVRWPSSSLSSLDMITSWSRKIVFSTSTGYLYTVLGDKVGCLVG